MPGWEGRQVADLGVMLAELFAHAGDQLSYHQDAVATEAYLATARRRVSVRRHARLVDYRLHDGCNARAWVVVSISTPREDIARGTTSLGPHRDELRFMGNGVDLGSFGSRGQVRTTLLTLKLAELEWMHARSGHRPVLLLDEVLAELDEARRADLLGRLQASSVFNVNPATGDVPKITFRIPDDADLGFAEGPTASGFRGQSPDDWGGAPLIAPPSVLRQALPHSPLSAVATPEVVPHPAADAADLHVYCDDFDHYLRWVESETQAIHERLGVELAPNEDASQPTGADSSAAGTRSAASAWKIRSS